MTTEAKVILTGEERGLLALYEKERAANERKQRQLEEAHRRNKAGYDEEKRLAADAARAIEQSLTPLERLKQEREKLRKQLQLGLITEQQYKRLLDEETRKFKEAKQNTEEYREAQRKLSDEKRRAQEITRGAETAEERYNRKLAELRLLLQQGRISQETFNRAVRQAKAELAGSTASGNNYLLTLGRIAGGYIGIHQGLSLWMSSNRDIIRQAEEISTQYDEMFRKFNIQTGLRGDAGQKRVMDVAEQFGVTTQFTEAAARQLVSSGFAVDEVLQGGALENFVAVLAASNVAGREVNPQELAEAANQFLSSQNVPKSAANLLQVGQGLQSLFKGTNIQVGNLTDLAKQAANFQGKLTIPEQLAAFSVLRDTFESPDAAVGLRSVVTRLSTATTSKTKVDALQRAGLTPEDVDFVGEDVFSVLTRLGAGFGRLQPEERDPFLKEIFEERGVAPAKVLLQNIEAIRQRVALQQDQQAFAEDVREGTSGRGAARNRLQVREERRRLRQDEQSDLFLEQIEAEQEAAGLSRFQIGLRRKGFELAQGLGASRDAAAAFAYGNTLLNSDNNISTPADIVERITQGVDFGALQKSLDRNTDSVEENNRLMRDQVVAPAPAAAAPQAPRRPPAAAVGRP